MVSTKLAVSSDRKARPHPDKTTTEVARDRDSALDNYDPLSPEDWNFDSVADGELIACCLWEYARESRTIKMAADVHWCHVRHISHREEYATNFDRRREDDEEARRINARILAAGFNYDAFCEEFWSTDFPLIKIYNSVVEYVRDGVLPWQKLRAEARSHFTKQVTDSWVLRPLAPATVGELETVWLKNGEPLLEIRQRIRPPQDDSEEAALWEECEPVTQPKDKAKAPGQMIAALTVDFCRFTDQEITEQFRLWLLEHRPADSQRPQRVFPGARRRGRKLIEYRVALERLGLMRLLHWRSPSELRDELPEAWKKIRTKERDFRREIREARKFFRRLFPFLPETERPESDERHGVWLPPLVRIADEVARNVCGTGQQIGTDFLRLVPLELA